MAGVAALCVHPGVYLATAPVDECGQVGVRSTRPTRACMLQYLAARMALGSGVGVFVVLLWVEAAQVGASQTLRLWRPLVFKSDSAATSTNSPISDWG